MNSPSIVKYDIPETQEQEEQSECYPMTDLGNSERLNSDWCQSLRYNFKRKSWLYYDGNRWTWDDGAFILRCAQLTVRGIYEEAAAEPEHERRIEFVKWAEKSESGNHIDNMINQARSLFAIGINELDQNPYLLNFRNGTLDLKTFELRRHDPLDYITALCPVNYNPEAKSSEWEQFLETIFCGNQELIAYDRRWFGYCLTGTQDEQSFRLNYGQQGENGKTQHNTAIEKVLGCDYAGEVDPQVFMQIKHGKTGPNEGLSALYGKRVVFAGEVKRNQLLDTELLKRMTGGESITHERKYEHRFEFVPTHKLVISGNHEPIISDTTNSIWRRLKKCPYDAVIPKEKQIPNFGEKLAREHGEAIIAWYVRGCREWQENGLNEPDIVSSAVNEYRRQQDQLADYLEENCHTGAGDSITVLELYESFKKWANSEDIQEISKRKFNELLREKGFQDQRGTGNKMTWYGIRLLTDEEKNYLVTNNTKFPIKSTCAHAHSDFPEKEITNVTVDTTPSVGKGNSEVTLVTFQDCPTCGRNEWTCSTDGKYLTCPCGYKEILSDG